LVDIKTFTAVVEGISPLLMHRFTEENEVETPTRAITTGYGTPREQAEKSSYRRDDGTLYFPGTAFGRLLREAGSNHKQRGSRKSVKYLVPAGVMVTEDMVGVHDAQGHPLTSVEVDSA